MDRSSPLGPLQPCHPASPGSVGTPRFTWRRWDRFHVATLHVARQGLSWGWAMSAALARAALCSAGRGRSHRKRVLRAMLPLLPDEDG